ncbi:MAG: ATP-binding protein [Bacteroidales bacterium]
MTTTAGTRAAATAPPGQGRERPHLNRRGLQVRVLLLVGVGLLASLLIMGGAGWLYLNSLAGQLLRERELLAESAAQHVEYVLQADFQTLQGISSAPGVNFEDRDVEPERAATGEASVRARLFDRVFIAGRSGDWLSAQGAAAAAEFAPLAPLVREAQASGRPALSGLMAFVPGAQYRLASDGTVRRVYALVPLRNWHGQIVAVAVGEIDPDGARFTALLSRVQFAAHGSIDLVDASGTVLASSDPSRRGFATGQGRRIERLLAGRVPTVETCRDCRQPGQPPTTVAEAMALAPLAIAPWAVAVRQPEREAFAPAYALGQHILLLGFALMVLALLFAWGVARSVRNPVALLTRAAERIAAGNLEQPIPALPDDEIGRLGRSLEGMRIGLKTSMDDVERANVELEARVAARTRELEGLYRELQAREEWRGRLLAKVIGAQEDERKRLARELHDETSQALNALVMRLETAVAAFPAEASRQRLVEARDLTVRTLDELHRLIYDLRPSVLDDLGLLSAVRWYAERHLEPLGVGVHWEFSGLERRLQPEVETALFRVMQEAITNIAKYAHAESVLIQCVLKDDSIAFEIEDDGDGFDPASLPSAGDARRGLGLMGMRERVELLGGTITIDAAPGAGVRIAVSVPLKGDARLQQATTG